MTPMDDDQDLLDLLQKNRKDREAALAPIQAAQGQPNLGAALAGMAGGFADAYGGGKTDYAGKAIAANQTASKLDLDTRIKALDEKDNTIKPLVDLAKMRQAERGADSRQSSADARQDKNLSAMMERAQILGGNRGASLALRQDQQASNAAGAFDKDPIITSLTKQQQQIARDKHTLDTATTLTPQIFNEIQTGIAGAIAGGHVAAQGTIHDLKYQSAELDYKNLMQRITNNPQDIGSPQVRKYLGDLIGRLGEAYTGNIADRANQIAIGKNYSHNPDAQKAVAQKLQSYAPAAPVAPLPLDTESTPPRPGMVKMSDGKETHWVPAERAHEAAADGFQVVK